MLARTAIFKKFFELRLYMSNQEDELITYIQREIVKYSINGGVVVGPSNISSEGRRKSMAPFVVGLIIFSTAAGAVLGGISSHVDKNLIQRGYTYCQELDIAPHQRNLVYPPNSRYSCGELEDKVNRLE